jgi:hypothetical protein
MSIRSNGGDTVYLQWNDDPRVREANDDMAMDETCTTTSSGISYNEGPRYCWKTVILTKCSCYMYWHGRDFGTIYNNIGAIHQGKGLCLAAVGFVRFNRLKAKPTVPFPTCVCVSVCVRERDRERDRERERESKLFVWINNFNSSFNFFFKIWARERERRERERERERERMCVSQISMRRDCAKNGLQPKSTVSKAETELIWRMLAQPVSSQNVRGSIFQLSTTHKVYICRHC